MSRPHQPAQRYVTFEHRVAAVRALNAVQHARQSRMQRSSNSNTYIYERAEEGVYPSASLQVVQTPDDDVEVLVELTLLVLHVSLHRGNFHAGYTFLNVRRGHSGFGVPNVSLSAMTHVSKLHR